MSKKAASARLLADENTSHRLVAAARRLEPAFPIVHIATWQRGSWRGLDDATLLLACAEVGFVLVACDRATLPWHAAQIVRAGDVHGGLTLVRRRVRSTDYGQQARLLTRFWLDGAFRWDWENRVVYLPKSL